jgi:hypothetical protein
MCCIGLVDDVTIDYLSQTYELKIHKSIPMTKSLSSIMLEFFRKYYSLEQAKKKVDEIDVTAWAQLLRPLSGDT